MKIPAGPEAMTGEWLTDVLRATDAIDRASVRSLHTQVLGGTKGAISQVAHLRIEYDVEEAGAPHSMIAKFAATDPERRAQVADYYREKFDSMKCLLGLLNSASHAATTRPSNPKLLSLYCCSKILPRAQWRPCCRLLPPGSGTCHL